MNSFTFSGSPKSTFLANYLSRLEIEARVLSFLPCFLSSQTTAMDPTLGRGDLKPRSQWRRFPRLLFFWLQLDLSIKPTIAPALQASGKRSCRRVRL